MTEALKPVLLFSLPLADLVEIIYRHKLVDPAIATNFIHLQNLCLARILWLELLPNLPFLTA